MAGQTERVGVANKNMCGCGKYNRYNSEFNSKYTDTHVPIYFKRSEVRGKENCHTVSKMDLVSRWAVHCGKGTASLHFMVHQPWY